LSANKKKGIIKCLTIFQRMEIYQRELSLPIGEKIRQVNSSIFRIFSVDNSIPYYNETFVWIG